MRWCIQLLLQCLYHYTCNEKADENMQHIVIIIVISMVRSSSSSIYTVHTPGFHKPDTAPTECVCACAAAAAAGKSVRPTAILLVYLCCSVSPLCRVVGGGQAAAEADRPRERRRSFTIGGPRRVASAFSSLPTARSPHGEAMISGLESLCLRC